MNDDTYQILFYMHTEAMSHLYSEDELLSFEVKDIARENIDFSSVYARESSNPRCCYVAIAGSVGNLPRVNNMDIQYGQAAVFTPSDFPFPSNAIKGEATPNTETTLIVDVDLNLLKELHHYGAVRTISDRRTDLYDVVSYQEGE